MKCLILYESRYGATAIYARALQKLSDFPIMKLSQVDPATLADYDVVIVGTCILQGQLYQAAQINRLIQAYPQPFWILYTVGISTPRLTNFDRILKRNFKPDVLKHLVCFHYRSRINAKRFSLMYMAASRMQRQPGTSLDDVILGPEELHLLERHGTTVQAEDLKDLDSMADYLKALGQYII